MQTKRDRRRLWIAIIASLFVHLVVAFSLAAFNQVSGPPLPLEDQPIELTMMDLSEPPPARKVNAAYIETDPSRETKEEPTEKTFESNANSRAASAQPATGEAPLPSQEGKDRTALDLQTQNSSLASQGAPVQPTPPPPPTPAPQPTASPPPKETPVATPSEPPKSTPLPEPVGTPAPDQLAMLTSTPPPAFRDPQELAESTPPEVPPSPPPPLTPRPVPPSAASAYQPEKIQTRIKGRLSDRGPSAVNALGTPLGRYQKAISDAIGSRWYYYMKSKIDLVSVGTAVISAEVDPSGHVTNLRVVANSANESFANICLQSFQEAKIAPIPPELIPTLPDGRMQLEFTFTTYANQ